MKKAYSTPTLTEHGGVPVVTADSRENNAADTFFSLNGPQPGLGGSLDTCVTPDWQDCL